MKKINVIFLVSLILLFGVINANAITTSASGSLFGDTYSYEFSIIATSDPLIYSATFENTSSSSLADALIDKLAFNMDAGLINDFSITNVNPVWDFYAGSGGIQFDYVGERTTPDTRLGPGDVLSFDFLFDSEFTFPTDPFALWTGIGGSAGTGIGGGDDFGQVAVSFQQLGSRGEGSDLLASNWTAQPVPEPGTIVLMGIGLVGLAGAGRKRLLKK